MAFSLQYKYVNGNLDDILFKIIIQENMFTLMHDRLFLLLDSYIKVLQRNPQNP